MKKILLLLLMFITVFTLTGCNKNKKEDQTTTLPQRLTYEGVNYELNKNDNYMGMNYKISSNLEKMDYGNSLGYFPNEDSVLAFIIRMFYYGDKDIKFIMKDISNKEYEYKEETIGNNKFINFKTDNDIDVYVFNKNKESYAITFASKIDISDLKNDILESIN